MLVPFDGSAAAERVLRRACRAAQPDGATLTVLCVVKIPSGLSPDELPSSSDDTVLQALVQAQEVCRDEGVVASFELSHARSLAQAILDETHRSGAVLVCLSLQEQGGRGETALMSQTVQQVLAAAPCSVLLSDPAVDLPAPAPMPLHPRSLRPGAPDGGC